MQITGNIEKILKTKNENVFKVIVNGKTYGFYSKDKQLPFKEGELKTLEITEKEGYKNITKTIDTPPKSINSKDDLIELGMAKNNAAALLPLFAQGKSPERALDIYEELVKALFKRGKRLREELL